MIIDEFRPIWQRSRQDRWSEQEEPSHGAYLRWWLENHGDSDAGAAGAGRVECFLMCLRHTPWAFLRANRDLLTFYDRAYARFGPLIAAEALRRLLLAMAYGPLPQKIDRDAEAVVDQMIREADGGAP
ncbi:hypothetical protein [Terricaulis sp.]|uniref:hypothetical protein n=1 Tax=Terricaulis sp. TaxID=2768686 RepID=UPI00378360EE